MDSTNVPTKSNSSLMPFTFRSFRFQWSADLGTSWAFEMETIILGWYILVETESVFLLTVFASLQFVGTLIAPLFGVIANRRGYRNSLCLLRAIYTAQALFLMILAVSGMLSPIYVFAVAFIMGIFRPSDLVMRYALVGQTIPSKILTSAMSISRLTTDSARVAGALAGAGTVALLGMGSAYILITSLYAASLLLSFGISKAGIENVRNTPEDDTTSSRSALKDLKEVFIYTARTPHLLIAMCIAFLVNLSAFPITAGLLPYVAKNIFQTNQTGLGYLAASFSFGAVIGSLICARLGNRAMSGRMIIIFCSSWYMLLLLFSQSSTLETAIPILILAGAACCLGLVPMSAMLVRTSNVNFRGGILGLRTLSVYGLPIGLLISSPLISSVGFEIMAIIYSLFGLAVIALIMLFWHKHIWAVDSPPNIR